MEEKEKNACLADSSGSDGSLSKDLSKRAEMNFSAHSVPLEIDADEKSGNKNDAPLGAVAQEQEEKVLSPDQLDKMLENEVNALMVCEKCHGPIAKLKKYGNSTKQFCSRQCAESTPADQVLVDDDGNDAGSTSGEELTISSKNAVIDSTETFQAIESLIPAKFEGEAKAPEEAGDEGKGFSWKDYQTEFYKMAAPASCFIRLSRPVKGLKPGMKLEAIDKNNPCNYCVATVIEVVGHRVRIRYDGFGEDSSQDFWCNFQAEELFQIGWCAENSFPLQPPTGISSTLEDWKIFLTKTLTGALASPLDLFRENENRIQTKVHSFHVGMKVEVIHPKRPSIICPATISKSLGPYHYQVTTEPLPNLPSHTFYGKSDSTGIFNFGWSARHGIDLAMPTYVNSSGLTKDKYMAMCRMKSAHIHNENRRTKNIFKSGQKLEAVDLEEPYIIRVATVFNVYGRILLLLFDGHNKFQYMDYESEDIYPIGWCLKTGHPLSTSHGIIYPSKTEKLPETEITIDDTGMRSVTMPSFHTVLGKQGPHIKEELNKKLKAKADVVASTPLVTPEWPSATNSKEADEKFAPEDVEKQENYCVHFNKTCVLGPHLDPEKVAKIPDKTASARPPAAVKLALEMIIEIAKDKVEAMDVIQEGFGAKLFSKGKSKVLKKGLFRFDTKVRASRLLKRLCKRLKSCEYFLSFDPPNGPCPFDCQNSGTTTLEGFIAMKKTHGNNDDNSHKLLDYRKRRGRPRKDSENPYESKLVFGKADNEPVKSTNLQLLNVTSYNGRPLIPIAPGSKAPVTIMSSSQLTHTRMPPPYDIGNHSSFIQHGSPVISSTSQPRILGPVNVRMVPPNAHSTPAVSGGDLSSPTLSGPNLATVVVVTKPQQVQGMFSIRSNVGNQNIRLPLSPSHRKGHLQVVGSPRSKFHGAIKIHGPMFDQAPGTMNPSSSGNEAKSNRNENAQKYPTMGQQLHIPSQNKLGNNQMFETETEMINEASLYRRSTPHGDKMSPNQLNRFVSIKQPMDIKLEPQEQMYQGLESSQSQRISPTVHIHLPSSNYRHITPMNSLPDGSKGNVPDDIRSDGIRPDGIRPDGVRSDSIRANSIRGDSISLLVSDHDAEKASHNHPSSAPPNASNIAMKYEIVQHQGIKRHMQNQHLQTHIPSSLPNHLKNHLKVATTATGDSQSALSPLHSPPPLRPAPSNQHRSIALRSPPNLTPSTVISHFDFSPVITTTSVISQTGRIIHHPGVPISSKCYMENHNAGNGQIRPHDPGVTATSVGNGMKENPPPPSPQMHGQLKTSTINFTYIPIKDKATDKIVYVPVNQEAEKDRHQPVFIYSKPHKQRHRFHEQMPGSSPQVINQADLKPIMGPLDDGRHQPFSGVTRKFTVRTLHRDSNTGSVPSGVTTVRIQGPNFKEVNSNSENQEEEGQFCSNDGLLERVSRNPSNNVLSTSDATKVQRIELVNQRHHEVPNPNERYEGDNSYDSNDISYEVFSDDDDDDDDDDECDFLDDNGDNDAVDGDGSNFDQGNSHGYRGRKRGNKHFLSRRKSANNQPYKLKYKQALEQAKFMREQRPSFFSTQIQQRNGDEVMPVSRDNLIPLDEDKRSFGSSDNTDDKRETREEQLKDDVFMNDGKLDSFNKGQSVIEDTEMNGNVMNKALLASKDHQVGPKNPSPTVFNEKNGDEANNLKRKRIDGPNKFGNGFVFGQWAIGDDIQVKKKKIINETQLSSAKYLFDPLEKVKLPLNPESWSEEDVANFINATECSQYADTLKDQEIDGSALLLLTRESLMEFAGMKLGPALKICGYVATLKGRLRMQQNMALIQG